MQVDPSPLLTFPKRICALIAVALPIVAVPAWSQANYVQGFDQTSPTTAPHRGPDDLIALGWDFRLQAGIGSYPPTYQHRNAMSLFQPAASPQGGSDYLVAVATNSGHTATWAVLPSIQNQVAGDTVSVWVNGFVAGGTRLFELRYSPSGGDASGSGAQDVGDFTSVLSRVDSVVAGWTLVSATVPGPGRLALRSYAQLSTTSSLVVGFDSLSVGAPVSCPSCLPLPSPGQMVHWTLAESPVQITDSITILGGGTVIVDPGVDIHVANDAVLNVAGTLEFRPGSTYTATQSPGISSSRIQVHGSGSLRCLGTPSDPVTLTGGVHERPSIDLYGAAVLRLDHCAVRASIRGDWTFSFDGAPTMHATHSTFSGTDTDRWIRLYAGTLVLEHCLFDDALIWTSEVHHTLRHLTFQNGAILRTYRRWVGQPILLDTITASGVTDDAPLQLLGNDHHLGPNNSIFGNRWPVKIGGGLTRDSIVPQSGNLENVIALTGCIGQHATLPDFGMDYHVLQNPAPEHAVVDPGVVLKIAPGTSITPGAGGDKLYEIILRGTPSRPIRLEQLVPGQRWGYLGSIADGDRATTDWVEIDGANWGVYCNYSSRLTMQNAIVTNCLRGSFANNFGEPRFRSCQILGNEVGLEGSPGLPGLGFYAGNFDANGFTNPNLVEGNTLGAKDPSDQITSDARGNWWGHAGGPINASNPGGAGDPVEGNVAFVPFRTALPDFTDYAPSVQFVGLSTTMGSTRSGDRVILRWEASDNAPIDHFRLEFSPLQGCSTYDYTVLFDDIPGTTRALVVEVPPHVSTGCVANPAFRIVAIDSTGKEGIDVWDYTLDTSSILGPQLPVLPLTLRPGDVFPGANPGGTLHVFDDGELTVHRQGGSPWIKMPPVSTDLARLRLAWGSGSGRSISPYFEIRPDPSVTGDLPPSVQLLTPVHGQSVALGTQVRMTWSAADDDMVRSFEIQASYNGGRHWHSIAKDLDPSTVSFDVTLPGSHMEIADARFRVLVRDRSFQVSSDGSDRVVTLVPGGDSLGFTYCSSSANSTGAPSTLAAAGSLSVSSNGLQLTASSLPPHTPGIFFFGDMAASVSIGNGTLCVGGALYRLQPVVFADGGGVAVTAVDLSIGAGAVIGAGQKWKFQFWFRDAVAGQAQFNLSSGLSLVFTP